MPISSIGPSAGFAPSLEVPGREQQRFHEQQRAAVAQLVAALPGNGKRAETAEEQGLNRMAADIARAGLAFNRRLQFVVDQQSNEIIVKVIDRATDEVIRILPPEELQRLHRNLQETIGFLFTERV